MGQVSLSIKVIILFLYNLAIPLAAQITSEMLPDDKPSKVVYYVFLLLVFSPVFGYILSKEFRTVMNDGLKKDGQFNTSLFLQAFGCYVCTALIAVLACTTAFYKQQFDLWLYVTLLSGSGLAISPTIAQFFRK